MTEQPSTWRLSWANPSGPTPRRHPAWGNRRGPVYVWYRVDYSAQRAAKPPRVLCLGKHPISGVKPTLGTFCRFDVLGLWQRFRVMFAPLRCFMEVAQVVPQFDDIFINDFRVLGVVDLVEPTATTRLIVRCRACRGLLFGCLRHRALWGTAGIVGRRSTQLSTR